MHLCHMTEIWAVSFKIHNNNNNNKWTHQPKLKPNHFQPLFVNLKQQLILADMLVFLKKHRTLK